MADTDLPIPTVIIDDAGRAFMLELTALTRKHGIAISGCGCCESPRLETVRVDDPRAGYICQHGENMEWVEPLDGYIWGRYSALIIQAAS